MANLIRLRDDESADHAMVSVDGFLDQTNADAVRIEPGDDARALIPHLERIRLVEVNFPVFGDGRGYSSARILREAGYAGELRAVGDVLIDQITALRRCGFDSFEPEQPLDRNQVAEVLKRFSAVYQSGADEAQPIWNRRHA